MLQIRFFLVEPKRDFIFGNTAFFLQKPEYQFLFGFHALVFQFRIVVGKLDKHEGVDIFSKAIPLFRKEFPFFLGKAEKCKIQVLPFGCGQILFRLRNDLLFDKPRFNHIFPLDFHKSRPEILHIARIWNF